jgi:hypothetical protein
LENFILANHSLDISPADLKSVASDHNDTYDKQLVQGIIKRLNAKVVEFSNLKKINGAIAKDHITYISVTAMSAEKKKHIQSAVAQLKKEGYNVRYEFTEAYDDGPNRSSPDYHTLVLVLE